MSKKINKKLIYILGTLIVLMVIFTCNKVYAASNTIPIPKVNISVDGAGTPQNYVDSIKLLIILTILTLLPSFIIMMTSFVRTIVVFGFLRSAIGTQQSPPNQVLIGLALFLTIFIMRPVYIDINSKALQPFLQNKITQEKAIEEGSKPLRNFMLKQTRKKDLKLFMEIGKMGKDVTEENVPLYIVIPSFMISELKTAFQIGFLLFVPFLIIDLVVSSVLMSMGMFMLPPVMIALPFKLLLFVMVDGWYLLIKSLILSFK
ncbi:flagellar type III secretion system pore protein FliP [Clostridium rectalis]|uniref:flagellar type III secretion system pore protein FliP n=1 Tax=Clostridium rectalis TaxID=2040295 RepID=UPI000F63F188|nr:flagellar type III secretion system pore protein FliP [Clostridium rectalis]